MKHLLLAFATLAGLLAVAAPSRAGTSAGPKQPEILRVGGDYMVASIDKLDDRAFRMVFKAVAPSGKFDVLRLESDHVHVAVKVGQQIRLSAEILSQQGDSAEVAQMVIFLPSDQGRVPVWLLSNKAPLRDLRATKYLEMHAPLTDYMVM